MILEKRFRRAQEAIAACKVDAWLFAGRETNILSEPAMLFLMPTQIMTRTAVIVTENQRIVVSGAMQMEELERSGLFTKHVLYKTAPDFEGAVAEALRALPALKRVALNISEGDPASDGLTVTQFNSFLRVFEQAGLQPEIVPAAPIMKAVRARKSDEEVACMQKAVDAAMDIYDEARGLIRVGMSGKDVQALFKSLIQKRGLGYSWHEPENPYVSVGPRSSYLCKMPPDDVFIQPGDVVNVDMGVQLNGFASDNQRTFYALMPGETQPPAEVTTAFETLKEINEKVAAAMKVGVNSDDLTAIGDEVMLRHGYEQGYKGSFGHEIVIFAHNGGISAGYNPYRPDLDKTLEYNHTFTLEPAILTSHGRVCQEEVVAVKPDGGMVLSRPQQEVWIIKE